MLRSHSRSLPRRQRPTLVTLGVGRVPGRWLVISLGRTGTDDDPYARALVAVVARPPPALQPEQGIVVGFPADWARAAGRPGQMGPPRPLRVFQAHEPLVLDLVRVLAEAGRGPVVTTAAAKALVGFVLEALRPPGAHQRP